MASEKVLSEKQVAFIKEQIEEQLTKRCIFAKVIRTEEAVLPNGWHVFNFETEKFQTVPVIFKSVHVKSFSSDFESEDENTGLKTLNINAALTYFYFEGGKNMSNLFNISFKFDRNSDFIKLKSIN